MIASGWLFDYHALGDTMVLWLITDDGARLRLVDPFEPLVFLEGPDDDVEACAAAIEHAGDGVPVGWTDQRRDFWTGAPRRVFAVRLRRVETWRRALDRYADRFPAVAWHNADLLAEQVYGFERDVFPLMRCRVEHDGERVLALASDDDRWATRYAPGPLRVAELSGVGVLDDKRPLLRSLTLACEGRATTWDDPAEMLASFQRTLDAADPDVLLTEGGDGFLLPLLLTVAQRMKFPLRLDRDAPPPERAIKTEGRSFFSYGRILYQAPEYALRGRWHLDRKNSFSLSHDGMEGLLEVARLSRIPVQRIARRSIGTGISSIQLDHAWRDGLLVPWKKTQPEAWKSASQLLKTDRGGLVYAPQTGFHENVVELDFVSMYPSIMARFNVSPETVNCPCCRNARVPEIGYTICEKRAGLVSRALGPIIAKRIEFKRLRKAAKEAGDTAAYARYDHCQDALKWMLVCCFGYLGYRNARFGRIEAHEAVSAYSREMLLRAREVCEEHGWRMLHANVDCVWIVKPGFADDEVPALCEAIEAATALPIAIEGIYRWLAFLPSRQVPDRPVPTRYFGAFRDGSVKYRGIECRRGDLPRYVKETQLALLKELATAPDAAAYRAMVPELLRRIEEMEGALWRHEVPLDDLLIKQGLSQDPEEYTGNGAQSLAARQSVKAGLGLHAGQAMAYVITSANDADRDRRVRLRPLFDADTAADPVAYVRLLRRAMNTLLWPAGVQLDEDRIVAPDAASDTRRQVPRRPRAPKPAACDSFFGMAFEDVFAEG